MMRRDFLAFAAATVTSTPVPVLAELFTSEGCSSCPPADALLARLQREQPVAGVRVIVVSEHVDYWNYIGWRDPYSSPLFSARQQNYARRFRLNSVYTPQLVIDGEHESVGNDWRRALSSIQASAARVKIAVEINATGVRVSAAPKADVWLALCDETAESPVTRGENAGRRLTHVMVARSLRKIGETHPAVESMHGFQAGSSRPVVFVQEPGQGRILGAA